MARNAVTKQQLCFWRFAGVSRFHARRCKGMLFLKRMCTRGGGELRNWRCPLPDTAASRTVIQGAGPVKARRNLAAAFLGLLVTPDLVSVGEVEVHAVAEALDAQRLRVRVVLQQQLLQVVEGALVVHPLPNL